MKNLRTYLIVAGVLLLIFGGWQAWRAANPKLTDEQQVRLHLDGAASALQDRSTARFVNYLAPNFTWNDSSRAEFNQLLAGAMWQTRDVQLQRSDEKIEVRGDQATTTGRFRVSYRSAAQAPPDTRRGTYSLKWKRIDGDWKIISATGGENLAK
ncbi:MAG TPA: nuclear transport factor 2 family protein [Abditibacteriaceae bacterium]|jgi:ketosteroid isomerase-like protein